MGLRPALETGLLRSQTRHARHRGFPLAVAAIKKVSMQSRALSIRLAAMALCAAAGAAQAAEPAPSASAKPSVAAPATFRGTGKLLGLDVPDRLITVDHGDMPSLGMPAMTMDFPVAASVDMGTVSAGQTVSFVLTVIDGLLTVTELRPLEGLQSGKKP